MFQKLILIFCLFICFQLKCFHCEDSCLTPLGSSGVKIILNDCEFLKTLLKKPKDDLSHNELIFLHRSFLNTTAMDNPLVCCDQSLNESKVFNNIGLEILRNQAELCGDNLVKRISFGKEAAFKSYPWSALLVYDTLQRFHCGGTLITNRYVLTAAHCIHQEQLKLIGVRLREYNTNTVKDCLINDFGEEKCNLPIIDVGIEKALQHPGFSIETAEHDIALIRLDRIIIFERSVRPICLPEYQNQNFDLNYGIITGWGATKHAKLSNVLLEAIVPIHNLDHCLSEYPANMTNDFKICAAGDKEDDEEGSVTCKGDSGGPLILRVEGQATVRKFRYLQAGIITLGKQNCSTTRNPPILFIKVSAYMDWIAANIEL